jgi:hypothetical protein
VPQHDEVLGIDKVLSGVINDWPRAAACPGAALAKWTWYTSVPAAGAGVFCAEAVVAATTPAKTTRQATVDFIEPPMLGRSEHQA